MMQLGILVISGIVILGGCAAQGVAVAPVEDRRSPGGQINGDNNQTIRSTPNVAEAPEVKPYVVTPIPAPINTPPARPSAPKKKNSAVKSLVSIADTKIKGGQYHVAANYLERALRHDLKNADLWSRLAEVNLLQRDYVQAESKALKSNALSDGNKALMVKNWRLISQSRRLRGDSVGADEAEVRAYNLSR